jgi:glycosyltransferase involved in cell wall biosynthesis
MNHCQQRISINGRFLTQPQTGVQRYSLELLNSLDRLLETGEIDSGDHQVECLLPPSGGQIPAWKKIKVRRVGTLTGNLWEQVDLPRYAQYSLLFAPANIGPYLFRNQIAIIHDASVFAYPEAFSLPFRLKYRIIFRRLCRVAKHIITVSEFSKKEICEYCHIQPSRISVVPPGHEHFLLTRPDSSILDRLSIKNKPYILTVASNSPHKNQKILQTISATIDQLGLELVIVGGTFHGIFRSQNCNWPTNVHQAGYVNDGELRVLYEGAEALVFPSLYEGFGLPVLEAMSLSCPVICSRNASMPEVGGDAVLYFDPENPSELCSQLENLMNNQLLQSELKAKGITQSGKFTWCETARRVWKIIDGNYNLD